MITKKIDEAVFDTLLEQAFADVIEEDVEKLQEEAEPCTISKETELKIRKLIAQAERHDHRKRMYTVIRAASIVLIVLLNLSLIGLLMVPSVNAEVKNVFADLFEKYTSYESKGQESYIVTTSEYEIGYIPDGFGLTFNDEEQIKLYEKDGGDGYIIINISDENFSRVSMDAEGETLTDVKINDMDAELSIQENDFTLFWYDGYRFFTIYTNIAESELMKIAENIKKWKNVQ